MSRVWVLAAVIAAIVMGVPFAGSAALDPPLAPTIDPASEPSNPTNQTNANFAFSDSDPAVTSFQCQLDGGGFSTCSSPQPYSGLTPNVSHTFEVKALDAVAQESDVASYAWTIDTLAPDAPTIDPASKPPNPTNQTGASFAFSSDPTAASFQCQLDGGGFSTCSSPQPYSGLLDGSHTFDVKALDGLANESAVTSYTWAIDTLAPGTPTIDPASKPPNPTNQTGASFAFSSDPTATSFQCQLDGGGYSTCSSPQPYSGLTPNASHTFEVRALDALANVSGVASYTWAIDTLPPDPPTIDPASKPPNPTSQTSANFAFSDSDPTAISFQCQLDGAGFSACSSPQPYSALGDGSHTFSVKALDVLAQESAASSYTWTVDTIHPLVSLSQKPPPITNQRTASFSFVSNKPGSTYECKLDGVVTNPCTDASPVLYTGLGDGTHTFSVQATAVSTGPPTTYTWTVDTGAPSTAITSTPPAVSNSASANFAFTSSEAGSTFVCGLDASGVKPCDSPTTYSGLGDGTHAFRVEAVDAAGNADATAAVYSWQIAGVGPATTDTIPPGNVKRLKRNVGYGSLKLSWSRPSDSDFDHVEVFVSTSAKSLPRTPVYKGKASRYTNRRFRNGLYYRYAVVSFDRTGNASRGSAAVVPPSILLRSPRDGRRVRRPPLLLWAGVKKATFYNVQVYRGGRKVLSAWPNSAKLKLSRSWRYEGLGFRLRRGSYRWYVWPGFGPRSKARYGQLLGQSGFRVR